MISDNASPSPDNWQDQSIDSIPPPYEMYAAGDPMRDSGLHPGNLPGHQTDSVYGGGQYVADPLQESGLPAHKTGEALPSGNNVGDYFNAYRFGPQEVQPQGVQAVELPRWQRIMRLVVRSAMDAPSLSVEDRRIANEFEERGYVENAPRFKDAVADETSTNTFEYWRSPVSVRRVEQQGITPEGSERIELTEHEGLVELDKFFKDSVADLSMSGEPEDRRLAQQAEELRDSLYFIGEGKLDEAASGFATLWKTKLQANPKQQLCVPLGVIRTGEMVGGPKKSTELLFDRVMSHFTPEEHAAYDDRILTSLDSMRRNGKDTTIILFDDWSKSGTQISNGLAAVMEHARGNRDVVEGTEVHLVAASDRQITDNRVMGYPLKTYAYFNAGADEGTDSPKGPKVTGTHSSVDFGFEGPVEEITVRRNALHPQQPVDMPPLTNVIRQRG